MVNIVEVGPRDGLQNESATIPTETKVAFVDALSGTGVGEIEVSAFVAPRKVPQLGDAGEVLRRIRRRKSVVYSALVPNEHGLDRALAAGVDKAAIFTAASETFNRKNINTSVEGSLQRFRPLMRRARSQGLPVRGYVSTAFWCAFEGRIAPEAVVDLTERLFDIGIDEVSISDTIGKAAPEEVARLLDLLLPRVAAERIAVHFHDTYGRGIPNVLQSWAFGIRTFDASVGGLGGCPFAPGATGNVATEDVAAALAGAGADVKVDRTQLERAGSLLDPFLNRKPRPMPEGVSPACMTCPHFDGEKCCSRERVAG